MQASSSGLTLLILAAGMGSRYGGIKQIDGFGPNGETILDYSLYDAIQAGFDKVVFVVREEIKEAVSDIFLPRLAGRVAVSFVVQGQDTGVPDQYINPDRTKPWGTGHAMLCAEKDIQGPFALINADDFYGPDAYQAMADFFRGDHQNAHALAGYTLQHVLSDHGSVSRGCGEVDEAGFLLSIVERTKIVQKDGKIVSIEDDQTRELSPNTPTSMNFWGFHQDIFKITREMFEAFLSENYQQPKAEFYIPTVVNQVISEQTGKIKVLDGGSTWFGVTYQQDKAVVTKKIAELIDQGVYPASLWT